MNLTLKKRGRQVILSLCLTFFSLVASAHEFWIEASNFTPELGETVSLSTYVGQLFVGDEVPNIEDFYSDYSVLSASGRSPVLGNLATDPPAYIKITKAGSYIVGQRTLNSWVDMGPASFIEYLNKQGLEFIVPQVDQDRTDINPIKEVYSRCVKAIIQTRDSIEDLSLLSTPLGYTLEIIPLNSPKLTNLGDTFSVKVLFQGRPLSKTKMIALNRDNAEHTLSTRTDKNGIAHFKLPYKGVWMFNSVHMIKSKLSDWESFWANLTFEVD